MPDFYSLELPIDSIPHSKNSTYLKNYGNSPSLVLPESKLRMRNRVEKFAIYFKREMKKECVQFRTDETRDSDNFVPWEAYLFYEIACDRWNGENKNIPIRFIGSCCFRQSEGEPWRLDWAWFHPFFRRRQHLRNAWPSFLKKYGDFKIEEPISTSMKEFLGRVKHSS